MEPTLLAVPNFSEGRAEASIGAIGSAMADAGAGAVRVLDVHSDPDHHRSVFTLAGPARALADALLAGARAAVSLIDVVARAAKGPAAAGQHPHVGSTDVVPIVYLDPSARGSACAVALIVGDRLGEELGLPVFLYGELTSDGHSPPRTRAELRRGGVAGLAAGGRRPDFGPPEAHASAGATLLAARAPLVAFNLQLDAPATLEDARRIAALVREGGEHGLAGLRAIGVLLEGDVAQVSMNVERPFELPLAAVVETVGGLAPLASAELVGLAPAAALEGFPEGLPIRGFDPARHVLENALG